jgi:hypothetical protein
MVVGLLGFCGIGGKLMLPVRGKLMGKGTNTNTRPQSPTKRSPKPSRDIFTRPCSKRRNGRKGASRRDY